MIVFTLGFKNASQHYLLESPYNIWVTFPAFCIFKCCMAGNTIHENIFASVTLFTSKTSFRCFIDCMLKFSGVEGRMNICP